MAKLSKGGSSRKTQLLWKFKNRFKHLAYFLIFYSGLLYVVINLLKSVKKNHPTIILFYHRFYRKGKREHILPYLEIEEFEKQILHLRKFYTFISIDEIADTLIDKRKFACPCVALTIDDGYLDNYILVYPILRQYHIPVMIYLTVGLIGTNSFLWIDDLEYGLMNTKVESFCFEELFGYEAIKISTFQEKEKAVDMLYLAMIKKSDEERQDIIKKLFYILNVDESGIRKRVRVMLNWAEIREMSENGVCFGAHTLSHPFLPAMPLETAKHEIRQSKEIVEKRLKKAVRHFAIPNGKQDDFTNELEEFCEEIGFDTIVTAEPGVVGANANRFSLRRVLPSPPLYYFACEVARYFFFPRPDDNFEISFGGNPTGERG
jgi:peptidoglycan/xylan/chitin deacetylase (PgdA/CDA1 family)